MLKHAINKLNITLNHFLFCAFGTSREHLSHSHTGTRDRTSLPEFHLPDSHIPLDCRFHGSQPKRVLSPRWSHPGLSIPYSAIGSNPVSPSILISQSIDYMRLKAPIYRLGGKLVVDLLASGRDTSPLHATNGVKTFLQQLGPIPILP
ncbi:unnamed protein product [Microthlaspi erraticum]|uniref:Uncharacterized protein n=1 Tax=Microthlaspi erraticum TaxID=1685480 RepID=A0A6D2HP98_9BRAS|nr:unnamed protein product [Microthlaspi erraticum]